MIFCTTVPSWFAVHCTSMNNTNGLISGDNKGHASYLMEKDMNKGALPGNVRPLCCFGRMYNYALSFTGRLCCSICPEQ